MNEKLLKATLYLFAVVVKEDGITEHERKKVLEFLNEQLNQNTVPQYTTYFDHTAQELLSQSDVDTENSIIQEICETINKELTNKQKTVLIKQIVELIMADETLSVREEQLVRKIGKNLKVPEDEINAMINFVTSVELLDFDSSKNIFVAGFDLPVELRKSKFIKREGLDGFMAFLYIPSGDSYFVKYVGNTELQLNGIPYPERRIRAFPTGSAIRSKKFDPVFYSDIIYHSIRRKISPISFEAKNISLKFPGGKLGLRNVNLSETAGNLVGLMGASGAGKSTLLNVLNGNQKPSEGNVIINGINLHTQPTLLEGVIGFVPQDDLLIEDLTVYQNLYFAAKLCFKDSSEKEIQSLVNLTLQNLGLLEIKNLKVGSPLEKTISGGQRKRLNIGLELLREPSVLFVDEPTSGLSSRDSENIMDLLKELTLKGKLIFVVIHQPSSDIFKMFDRLIILDVGGFQIYDGNPVQAVIYFKNEINLINKDESVCIECGNVNPEQIFNIIETKVLNEYGHPTRERKISPKQWNEIFKENYDSKEVSSVSQRPPSTLNVPGRLSQFNIFLTRDVLSKFANKQYLTINLLEAPILAFILAFIIRYFSDDANSTDGYLLAKNVNIPSYLFMSVIVALFMGLTVSAEEIIKDRKIKKREEFLNLNKASYLYSKIAILFSLSAFQTMIYVVIGNSILEIKDMGLQHWIVIFSSACFANMLGLNISSAFKSAVTIYILIPILLIPQLLLSGVVVKFDKLNPYISNEARVPIIGDIMASRWAFEAMMVTQFKDNKYESIFYNYDKAISDSKYKTVYYLPQLKTKLENAKNHVVSGGDRLDQDYINDLKLLRNELKSELSIVGESKFDRIGDLNPGVFNSEVYNATIEFINQLENYYDYTFTRSYEAKNDKIAEMTNDPDSRKQFENLRNNFHNEQVASIVTNASEPKRISEANGRLIRKIDPVFYTPAPPSFSLDFRTIFYAPVKYFAGSYWSTFWFNVTIIWIMSLVLFLTLYFDLLRKLVEWKR